MLDIKRIRENPEAVQMSLARRGATAVDGMQTLLEMDRKRRAGISQSEQLKNKKKTLSAEVGKLKQKGEDAAELMEEVRQINEQIKELDDSAGQQEEELESALLAIPNTPDDSVPQGTDESSNEFIREWGAAPKFDFEPRNHVELGEALDILDLKRAVKIAGTRFAIFKKEGARLLRAIIQFMLDVQTTENGYTEVYPPVLVNRDSLIGTGQLPKFEEDLFKLADDPTII